MSADGKTRAVAAVLSHTAEMLERGGAVYCDLESRKVFTQGSDVVEVTHTITVTELREATPDEVIGL